MTQSITETRSLFWSGAQVIAATGRLGWRCVTAVLPSSLSSMALTIATIAAALFAYKRWSAPTNEKGNTPPDSESSSRSSSKEKQPSTPDQKYMVENISGINSLSPAHDLSKLVRYAKSVEIIDFSNCKQVNDETLACILKRSDKISTYVGLSR